MYDYKTERRRLFTDEGQRLFMKIRDGVFKMLEVSGAVRMGKVVGLNTGSGTSDWLILACVDRMVELGDIREITHLMEAGQNRVFVKA